MFANTYQNGYYTEVWDSRVNPDKNATYKQLFKKVPSSMKNFYDKQVKSFIYELEGNEKLCFPHDDKNQQLSLHQRYLVLQIHIPLGSQWSIQLGINDITNTKKRINITTMPGKQQLKYFSFRYPLEQGSIEKGIWMFLAIDLYSFVNAFKNTVFRSLDTIVLCSSCKVRRIFTMKEWTEFQIPKTYWLSSNVPQTMQIIEFKENKEPVYNMSLLNSSVHYSKLIESKIVENHPRNIEKSSPLQQKSNLKGTVKLPGVINKTKQLTPLKSSKMSQKVQLSKNDLLRDFGGLGKSNRSLTKADIIIQKSKIRLNSLQQKEQEILSRLKSEDNRFSDKIHSKQKMYLKNQNLFKSDLFKSDFSQSAGVDSKITKHNQSPKLVKMKKNFEEDNIFKQQSYSSSYSRQTQKQSFYDKKNNFKVNSIQNELKSSGTRNQQSSDDPKTKLSNKMNTTQAKRSQNQVKNQKNSKVSQRNDRHHEQIIQEDVWTDDEEQKKPQTPIQEMILSQQNGSIIIPVSHPAQTTITKQNNHQLISKQSLNSLKAQNELQLIYDQMIGCYYHPQTNTYYQIRN